MMIQRAGAAAGRGFLLMKQGQQLGRGLATLPTPKFFDYKVCVGCVCLGVYVCIMGGRR